MDPKQYDNRCDAFRYNHRKQVLRFVEGDRGRPIRQPDPNGRTRAPEAFVTWSFHGVEGFSELAPKRSGRSASR